jgi:hypothetical protein
MPLDWAWPAPSYWDRPRGEGDYLTGDLCVWTDEDGATHHFVRGVLPIPVLGSDDVFAYGLWSSLSARSFDRLLELWDDPARVHEPPYFGWLSNRPPGYPDTRALGLDVVTRALELRPTFFLHDADHPLVHEQRNGITAERVQEIAELNLH